MTLFDQAIAAVSKNDCSLLDPFYEAVLPNGLFPASIPPEETQLTGTSAAAIGGMLSWAELELYRSGAASPVHMREHYPVLLQNQKRFSQLLEMLVPDPESTPEESRLPALAIAVFGLSSYCLSRLAHVLRKVRDELMLRTDHAKAFQLMQKTPYREDLTVATLAVLGYLVRPENEVALREALEKQFAPSCALSPSLRTLYAYAER